MIRLREDQKRLIHIAAKELKKSSRIQIISACGTGKTVSSCFLSDKLLNNKTNTLVVVPSLLLMKQTIDCWISIRKKRYNYWGICSDSNVDNVFNEARSIGTELDSLNLSWDQRDTTIPNVFFVTLQSYEVFVKFAKDNKIKTDYAFIDEAHKTTGSVNSPYTQINQDSYYKIKKRISLTATPRYSNDSASPGVVTMDNKDYFGKVVYNFTFRQAIKKKLLTDYKIILVGVEGGSLTDEASAYALEKVVKKYGLKKTIVFHSNIKQSKEFNSHTGYLKYKHIDGKMNSRRKSKILKDFSSSDESIALNNARCLTEGIDIPSVDSIMFNSPRTSVVDIVQAIGRCVRKFKGKEFGYIIIPVLELTDNLSYERIMNVLEALSLQDEELFEIMSGKMNLGDSESKTIKDYFENGEDTPIDFSKIKIKEMQKRLLKSVTKQDYIDLLSSKGYKSLTEWKNDKDCFPTMYSLNSKTYRHKIKKSFFPNIELNTKWKKQDYIDLLTKKKYKSLGEWDRDKKSKPSMKSLSNKPYKDEVKRLFFSESSIKTKWKKQDYINLLTKKKYSSLSEWLRDKEASPSRNSLYNKPYKDEIMDTFFSMSRRQGYIKEDYIELLLEKKYSKISDWENDTDVSPSKDSLRRKAFREEIEQRFFPNKTNVNRKNVFSIKDYRDLILKNGYTSIKEWRTDKGVSPSYESLRGKRIKDEVLSLIKDVS